MVTKRAKMWVVIILGLCMAPMLRGDWFEDFEGDPFDWSRWDVYSAPPSAGFGASIEEFEGNHYLAVREENAFTGQPGTGSAFGIAFVKDEDFTDVRVGAVVNVTGEASQNFCGLGARASYQTGFPQYDLVASAYIIHVNWEDGPANLSIDIEKVSYLQNRMRHDFEAEIPGYAHRRSYYAELDVVGTDPTYVTGSLYEYEGGPLLARVGPIVDTNGIDWWEDDPRISEYGHEEYVFLSGKSGVFGQNENPSPTGYLTQFDDVFSTSQGPGAVGPDPADGATAVALSPTLSWVEASYGAANGRRLWLGPAGAMMAVEPAGSTYEPGVLRAGQTYQWRVDQIDSEGAAVAGPTWSFTTVDALVVDDFESYANDAALRNVWDPNMASSTYDPNGLNFVETGLVAQGAKAMRLEYRNILPPFMQMFSRTFATPQDWTADDIVTLSVAFQGRQGNAIQPIFIIVEDDQARQGKAEAEDYAVLADEWNTVYIPLEVFAAQGVDPTGVKRLILGIGSGEDPGQGETTDVIYVDNLRLHQAQCFLADQIDVQGDVNGDCTVNLEDFLVLARGWLNSALAPAP